MDREIKTPSWVGWIAGIIILVTGGILWNAYRLNPQSNPTPRNSDDTSDHTLERVNMKETCKKLILKQLKAPSTASFSEDWGELPNNTNGSDSSGSDMTWNSWVDAENSFGAKLRSDFTCTYTRATDTVQAVLK